MENQYIVNPASGRLIKVGGTLYMRMLRNGTNALNASAEACSSEITTPPPQPPTIPTPPSGYDYYINGKTKELSLRKTPQRMKATDIMRNAAMANLRHRGEELTETNISDEHERIMRSTIEASMDAKFEEVKKPNILRITAPVPTPIKPKRKIKLVTSESSCGDSTDFDRAVSFKPVSHRACAAAAAAADYSSSSSEEDEPAPILCRSKSVSAPKRVIMPSRR